MNKINKIKEYFKKFFGKHKKSILVFGFCAVVLTVLTILTSADFPGANNLTGAPKAFALASEDLQSRIAALLERIIDLLNEIKSMGTRTTQPWGTRGTNRGVCFDQCLVVDSTRCFNNTQFQTCGNYDADSCLEWSSPQSCPTGQTCQANQCVAGGANLTNLIEDAVPVDIYSVDGVHNIDPKNYKVVKPSYTHADILVEGSNIYLAFIETETETVDPQKGIHKSGQHLRFFKSSDYGKTWEDKGIIATINSYHYFWVRIRKLGNDIYVGVSGGGSTTKRVNAIYHSSDDGSTWNKITLPDDIRPDASRRDFLPLDSNTIIFAYNDKDNNMKVAKSIDSGKTWSAKILEKRIQVGDHEAITFSYPLLEKSGNKVYLVYRKERYFYYHPRDFSVRFVESSNGGDDWSSPVSVIKSYKGRIVASRSVDIFQSMYFFFSASGNRKIVGYKIDEVLGPEAVNKVLGFASGTGTSWNPRLVKTADGLVGRPLQDGSFSFAASENGQYLAFFIAGGVCDVEDWTPGMCRGNKDSWGTTLLYSTDSGTTWKYKRLPQIVSQFSSGEDMPALGDRGIMPNFHLTNNGEVLIVYPEKRYQKGTSAYTLKLKFIGGKIE